MLDYWKAFKNRSTRSNSGDHLLALSFSLSKYVERTWCLISRRDGGQAHPKENQAKAKENRAKPKEKGKPGRRLIRILSSLVASSDTTKFVGLGGVSY